VIVEVAGDGGFARVSWVTRWQDGRQDAAGRGLRSGRAWLRIFSSGEAALSGAGR